MLELIILLLGAVHAALRNRRDLVLENLLLRHQLAVAMRPKPRPRLKARDKLLWVLGRRVYGDWRRYLIVVTPDTVVRWHRRGWRLVRRWRSRARMGRPRVAPEVRELVATMASEHPTRGSERIRGELRKPGIVGSTRSVRQYRRRGPARPPRQSWRTFLTDRRPTLRAADPLTVPTRTFGTMDVLVFVSHGRRGPVHLTVAASPTAAWIRRHPIQATPWGRTPDSLPRDRDAVSGRAFRERARGLGIETVLTPIRAPRANAVAERVVGTRRRECLDHLIVVDEAHRRAVIADFMRADNQARPHRTLAPETPIPAVRATAGPIRSRRVLSGLHHAYERAA